MAQVARHGDEGRSDTGAGGRAGSGRAKQTGVHVMLWGWYSSGLDYLFLVSAMYKVLLWCVLLGGP
jgi:hypothetical protein